MFGLFADTPHDQQLADWEAGIQVRNDFRAYAMQAQGDEEVVLRWLVAFVRRDRSLGLNLFDIAEGDAQSPVRGIGNACSDSRATPRLVPSSTGTASTGTTSSLMYARMNDVDG